MINTNNLIYVVIGGFIMWFLMFIDERFLKHKKTNKVYVKNILSVMFIIGCILYFANISAPITDNMSYLNFINEPIMVGKPNF